MEDQTALNADQNVTHRRAGWACAGLLLVLTLIFMERALFPPAGQAVGGLDVRGLFYPWLSAARSAIREGHLPLWDVYQFGGYPFMSNPQTALFYPPTWLAILLPVNAGIGWYVALHVWLAGVGMLLFVYHQSRPSWTGALLAALAFAFSGFTAARVWAGHIGLLATYAWLPWLLLALARSVERADVWSGVIGGLPLGLAILAGHTTSLIYVGLAWLAFALFLAITTRRWPLIARQVVIAGLTALALSAIQVIPLVEFSRVSTRAAKPTFEFASAYSLPPAHLITLLIPDYFGEPTRAGYWSVPNFEELTYYVGLLPLLGVALGLRRPTRLTWFCITLGLFGLLLALGSYGFLYRLLYDLLPPFRVARAPGRAASLFVFAAAVLLGDAVSTWERIPARERVPTLRPLLRWLLITIAGVGVAGLAATGAVFAAQHPTDTSGRLWHQVGGWSLALACGLVGGGLLWAYFTTQPAQQRRRSALAAGLVALVVTDLWLFGFKLVRLDPVGPSALWSDASTVIGPTTERVLPWGLSIFEQNGAGQVGLRSVFGYNALEVAANQALTASVADPRSTAYDILGVGYVIAGGPLDEYAQGDTQGERALELVDQRGATWVYRRSRVMPLARLVSQVEVIQDDTAAIARVHQPDFDPGRTAILREPPPCEIQSESAPGTACVIEARPGYWQVETHSDAPGLLVLAETAYPGWRVTVDGQAAEALVAYTAVRAVCAPAGTHTIEWTYSPVSFKLGGALSLAALGMTGLAAITTRRVKDRAVSQPDAAQEATDG
jgi:hypothetical protein